MPRAFLRWLTAAGVIAVGVVTAATMAVGGAGPVSKDGDTPVLQGGTPPLSLVENEEYRNESDLAFISRRTAGDIPLDLQQAGALRAEAARAAARLRKEGTPTAGPSTFTGAWRQLGPTPIQQVLRTSGTLGNMSGRIGALVVRPSTGQFILGAAQGGIWAFNSATSTWVAKTSDQETQAIGALAIAPSNDAVIYAGTGEGALSGDSYFGDGVLKSTDGGNTWTHVSGDYFRGVATTRIVVDPTNAEHVYAAVSRGRGGARRTSPTIHSRFGVWESKNGGADWSLIQEVKDNLGATDLEIDPRDAQTVYSTFWGDAIYKSTNGGASWSKVMAGLPVADYAGNQTRFSISISHPSAASPAVLYAGFDWVAADGYHKSRVFKSTNAAGSWTLLPAGTAPDIVEDYCGQQCTYDNVIEADPTNPNIVFAGGMFDYDVTQAGGIYRSDDGGATWRNLGYDQHPDFHALAFNPTNTQQVVIGNDGGVWTSNNQGGRQDAASPLSARTWTNLNGNGLAIAQFTSIGIAPQVAAGADSMRFWGGTQDNGTMRKSVNSKTWFGVGGGDGGQVLVDPTVDTCALGPSCYVYGTFYSPPASPYRWTDGGASFSSNSYIRKGLDLNDRSDFYEPFVMNPANPSQLFIGTYRLYRTDNARTPSAGDVQWKAISGDLTTGCTGTAPNGARNCTISAIGVGGGRAVYTGSLDGLVNLSTDAQFSDSPTWTRVGKSELPARPVSSIAVDRSNYRIAYVAFNGFNAATPSVPGHVFRTLDGGASFSDVTGDLPDTPVNSLILDPSYPNTLYAGTDVGAFVTYNGGAHWTALGTGFPLVAIWQLDLDPSHRVLAAGTHGRGAYTVADTHGAPALVLSKVDAGKPVGASSNVTYTITLKNIGNAAAANWTISDPVPANTSFVSAQDGGTFSAGKVTWSGTALAPGDSTTVHFTVTIAAALKNKVASIVNDGLKATAADGFGTTGSPFVTPLAPPYALQLAPAAQRDGGRVGTTVPYKLTVSNVGANADTYALSAASTWTTTFFDGTCTTPLTTTPSVASGDSLTVCAKVAVSAGAANGATNTATVTATSVGGGVAATATIGTIAINGPDTLLVDDDDNGPDVAKHYADALTANGISYLTWDIRADKDLGLNYTKSFKNIVWFTGNSYPAPVTPYEAGLKAFLDNGGRLLMSGQDILDQGAGTTTFVHDYLHIDWDGSETQNDKATAAVHGVAGNPVSNGIGTVPLDHSVLGGATFEDRINPINGALNAFTDDTSVADALSFSSTYKVVFLAFPFEAYGTAAQKADLMNRTFAFFAAP
jgi:uncharacterized repeat protein (TIGR01451 family)